MIRPIVVPRTVLSLVVFVLIGAVGASAPCGVLLGGYLESRDREVVPCLVDMQESGLCFRLPGMTLESATRTLDAHLQEQGASRPDWRSTRGANGSTVTAPSGERIEIVIAHDGPFATSGTCRTVTDRRGEGVTGASEP